MDVCFDTRSPNCRYLLSLRMHQNRVATKHLISSHCKLQERFLTLTGSCVWKTFQRETTFSGETPKRRKSQCQNALLQFANWVKIPLLFTSTPLNILLKYKKKAARETSWMLWRKHKTCCCWIVTREFEPVAVNACYSWPMGHLNGSRMTRQSYRRSCGRPYRSGKWDQRYF